MLDIEKKRYIYLQKKDSKLLMIFNGISKDNKFVRQYIANQPSKFRTKNQVEVNDDDCDYDVKFKLM